MELLANEKIFRDLLKSHGHSIQSLANVVGCDRTMISKIVNGKAIPGHRLLSKILNELQVSYEELFTEVEENKMAGRPKKYTKLEEMTIIQIHEMTKDVKVAKKQAEKLGVSLAEWNAFKYKPENKKKLDALKKAEQKKQADLEMGLEIQDAPVIKTKVVATIEKDESVVPLKKSKGASQIPVVETIEKSKYDELENKHLELGILEASRRDELESLKKISMSHKKENERLRDQIERLKKNKEEAEEQQKKSTSELNERSRKAENLMRAAETRVAQLQKQVDEQNEIIKKKNETIQFNVSNALKIEEVQTQLEQERADEVARYEALLKEKDAKITELEKNLEDAMAEGYASESKITDWRGKYNDLDNAYKALEADFAEYRKDKQSSEIIYNDDLTDDSQYVMLPANENIKLINPPVHYATKDNTDLIKRFADKKKRDFFVGAMVFNINKYCERFGEKDNELSEARKMKDYSTRLVDYLEQEQSEMNMNDTTQLSHIS
ncbi:helix-turn-helix domain-containing protein [Macrococcoides bohemicum]|uniref:helix-turn-helix domain-containing protein n=1 Tax=Macrococcoides bohemicum TaxID=1903056 RepID=UPI0010593D4E|nr:helix-turn-helix transcriptional regulator [Macrococcus bohemicus]TDL40570.1 helix-turn-helix domain-containing protein [Macrococcus bohemicus]